MSAATVVKAAATLSMADGCLTCLHAAKVASHHTFLPLHARRFRLLHLSYPSSPFPSPALLSLGNGPSLVALVAQTSDWARQEEEENDVKEEGEVGFGWVGGEGAPQREELDAAGVEAGLSEWDGEGGAEEEEHGGVVAEGDPEGDALAEEEEEEEESYPEPPEEAKLFVGNLPYDMDSEKLAQLFEKAGIVEVAEVIYNRQTDQSRGFGFASMSTVEEAEKAIEMFHRYDVGGRLLTVNKAAPRGSRPEITPRGFEPSFRIYVGNLPWQVDDVRLEQVFSEHGKVVDARVVYDRETGRSRGFGFVTMSTQPELDDAIAALDGQTLDGRAIRVNVAEERPKRGSF